MAADSTDVRTYTHEQLVDLLLRHIEQDTYPSPTMMDMVEATITRQKLPEYVDILLDKVREERYPSIDMMRRLQSLA